MQARIFTQISSGTVASVAVVEGRIEEAAVAATEPLDGPAMKDSNSSQRFLILDS